MPHAHHTEGHRTKQPQQGGRSSVLAIGAHPDDIELGCAGTLLAHFERGDRVTMLVMTPGERGPQDVKSRVHEQEQAAALLGADLRWGGFTDGEVVEGRESIQVIERVLLEVGATTVYTHTPNDSHQDHRATALSSLAAARRSSSVLCYESPSSLQFMPSLYVNVSGVLEKKLAVMREHESQVRRNGFVDLGVVEAQARYRGFYARCPAAEGFETPRFTWDLG